LAALALLALACDQGKQHDQTTYTPPLNLIGANVGDNKPVATNGVIELAFDRFLNPATTLRQGFSLHSALGEFPGSPVITYDPITRVVRIERPAIVTTDDWLEDNVFYTLTLNVPGQGDYTNGFRAIDGATFDPSQPSSSRQIAFFACSPDPTKSKCAAGVKPVLAPAEPPISFCDDVQPIFANHCSGSKCHAAPGPSHQPAAGLVLDDGEGIRYTAIGKSAQGSTTGATAKPLAAGKQFGVNMPVIEAHSPGTSWLMYKLLLATPTDHGLNPVRPFCFADGGVTPAATPVTAVTLAPYQPLADSERAILSSYILGREMPFPSDPSQPSSSENNADNPPLTFDEMERLRIWIRNGAPVPQDNCVPCSTGDAGAPPPITDGGKD
jgi:hypothetical protein